MKHLLITLCLLLCFTKSRGQNIKAMTYNIRLDVASDGANAWPNRKQLLSNQILFYAPDFLGVQEALPSQMSFLKQALSNYQSIGQGRDGIDQGEYSAIFYNTNRFNLEKSGTFWLSNTSKKQSKGWDAAYPRICTYGLFIDKLTSKKIWIFNTHLDHKGTQAQLQGLTLINDKIAALNTNDDPVLLMGDFNVEPNSSAIINLSKDMSNTETLAQIKFGPQGTFNGFNIYEAATRKIDYIFTSKPASITVLKHAVISTLDNLKYPSDHFPVFIEFAFK
ncbi:endonuclease/exonuclease/phosphatase family metal-dependent hydrolase [Formosa algae]|uniref:Endonuclease/exonuclease/phosphatase family metal-dependent hydrolase n=2 Tax=Formosa algae TaxID=225843 RepID=A0A9X1CAX9_9FLAO|nr:endonuclease/exonuclease/phosphatase family protein [Formosa algae]MBP1839477.1 endonuclease/exonuclease/phosphatase family metal-dependent hydrolase [Formosa algae]MDQ0334781.1 endonuclease/exonuclease/phosphatase family metal-dependent hydrolase [Formosa algae]OEI82028.1 endonuclease/exonuclease/phosphatase [Formosa algae]